MKQYLLIALILVVAGFYLGSVIGADHPIDTLYEDAIWELNEVDFMNFKSLLVVKKLGANGTANGTRYPADHGTNHGTRYHDAEADTWHYKRQGVYDVKNGDLHYLNVRNYDYGEGDPRNTEEDTSLSFAEAGELVLLPIQEVIYRKPVISLLDRETAEWAVWGQPDFRLLELLPLDANIINRHVELKASENRGKFVVYTLEANPLYLTKTFPRILLADDLNFAAEFVAAEFKILIYSDTPLTHRIYSNFIIKNPETNDYYFFQLDTYFSGNYNLDYFKEL